MALKTNITYSPFEQTMNAGVGLKGRLERKHYDETIGNVAALIAALDVRVTALEASSSAGVLLDYQSSLNQQKISISTETTINTITFTNVASSDIIYIIATGTTESDTTNWDELTVKLKRNGTILTTHAIELDGDTSQECGVSAGYIDVSQSGTVTYTTTGVSSGGAGDFKGFTLVGLRFSAPA